VSSFYDNAGRPYLTTKPYIDLATNSKDLFTPGDFTIINTTILDNPDNYFKFKGTTAPTAYAYSETEYYDDPLGRVKKTGAPGVDYHKGSSHFTRSWTFGVPGTGTHSINYGTGTITLENGFITSSISDDILDAFCAYLLSTTITGCDHFLNISRDANILYTQELKDLFSRTIATRVVSGTQIIVSNYTYDVLGNILNETAPKDGAKVLIGDNKYEYNKLGQLTRKETPDGVIEQMFYDDAGNLTDLDHCYFDGTRDWKFSGLIYVYDNMSRIKEIKTDALGYTVLNVKKYYDNTDELIIDQKKYNIPIYICEQLQNLQGRIVAEIAFNKGNKKVVDLYSYNDDGQISEKYKIIPGLPLQQITYTYDIHGKVLTERFECGTENSLKTYIYNPDGYLSSITFKGATDATATTLVEYTYDNFGRQKEKKLSAANGKVISYEYNIRDWLEKIVNSDPVGFSQSLIYGNTTFNGNIDEAVSKYRYTESDGTNKLKEFDQVYSYDNVNRLTSVQTNNGSEVEFNANYTYDQVGRFKSKQEGTKSIHNEYSYYSGKNRLLKSNTSGPVYLYDRFGNMILDASKNMTITYDWRNMPVEFTFYNHLPVGETSSSKIYPNNEGRIRHNDTRWTGMSTDYISYLEKIKEVAVLSKVYILYDAAGNRVLKTSN
jgi:YD repeat-containing protein